VDSDAEHVNRYPMFSCPVDVFCAIDKDTSSNLSGVVEFVETLRRALQVVLTEGGCRYDVPESRLSGSIILLHYTLICEGRGCG
jgi:hypothetical protein